MSDETTEPPIAASEGARHHHEPTETVLEPRSRRRRSLVFVAALLLIPVLFVATTALWWNRQLDPAGAPGARVRVAIAQGWSVARIGDELKRRGVVSSGVGSSFAWQLYTRAGNHRDFQAGDYALRKNLGLRAAVEALERGPEVHDRELTVVPGLWLTEVAKRVHTQLGLSASKFLQLAKSGAVRSKYMPATTKSLEGMLFPDTYRIGENASELDVLRTMVRRFDQVGDSLALAGAARAEGRTPHDIVKIASLIQSEVTLESERPLVASVIDNRLDRQMPLQIDATVLYAIQQRKPSNTAADRAVRSPYNTYVAAGLPPTPIATVGRSSLDAALHPARTNNLYYVLIDKSGRQAFAATYAEHLRNVAEARAKGLLK